MFALRVLDLFIYLIFAFKKSFLIDSLYLLYNNKLSTKIKIMYRFYNREFIVNL